MSIAEQEYLEVLGNMQRVLDRVCTVFVLYLNGMCCFAGITMFLCSVISKLAGSPFTVQLVYPVQVSSGAMHICQSSVLFISILYSFHFMSVDAYPLVFHLSLTRL